MGEAAGARGGALLFQNATVVTLCSTPDGVGGVSTALSPTRVAVRCCGLSNRAPGPQRVADAE